jgi:hypothetical protein
MTNEEELLSQVQEILDEAGKTLDSDRPEGINAEFQQVEQKMWEELGSVNDIHQLFTICVVQDSERAEALQDVGNGKAHLVQGNGTIDGQTADTLVNMKHIADAGNIYDALNDKWLALDCARDPNNVGVLVRLGAKSSEEEDTPEDKKRDCSVTMMVMADHLYVAVRHHDNPTEVDYSTIFADDYEGQDSLVNALLTFHVAAREFVLSDKDIAEALYKDLSRQREKETSNTNNQQQSKEDK